MAEVVPLKGATRSDKKSAWLDQVALAYDTYVADCGQEPEALFFIQVGEKSIRSSWHIGDPWQHPYGASAAILIAMHHLQCEATNERD